MKEFLLILKGSGMNDLAPGDMQSVFEKYQKWVGELNENYLGGQRLEERGSLLTGANDPVLTDGPFLESKEIIAGYFLIRANDLDEATSIAQSSPHLGLYTIEVRPIVFPKMN